MQIDWRGSTEYSAPSTRARTAAQLVATAALGAVVVARRTPAPVLGAFVEKCRKKHRHAASGEPTPAFAGVV